MSDQETPAIVEGKATPIGEATPAPLVELSDSHKQARLYAKFALVMAEVSRLGKSRENKQQNFKYAPVEDVKDLIRPLLAKHNVGYTVRMTGQDVREQATKNATRFITRLNLEYKFVDGDSGGTEILTWTIEASDYGDFAITKALSMGLKYLFMTMFAISSGYELDADAGTPSTQEAAPTQAMMNQLLVMYRAMYPQPADKAAPPDDVILALMFDKACGEGAPFTLDNYAKVLARLVSTADLKPVKTPKQKAKEEADKATRQITATPAEAEPPTE